MSNKKNKNKNYISNPSADSVDGQPENCTEMVNRYGRCNVQLTADTENKYPAIAQGLSEEAKQNIKNEENDWLDKNIKRADKKD